MSRIEIPQTVRLLQTLIEIPSVSRDEQRAADALETFMSDYGLNPRREANNVWAVCADYDASRPTLLLNAHIDTVAPAAGWQREPFKATLEGDRLYGLGANDCGGGLVTLLCVYSRIVESERLYNVLYAASAEEEVSGRNGFSRMLPLLPPVDVAIVGEPTGMQPAIAERGLMVLDVTAHGRAGHAAREEGVNAIYKALKDIEWFRTYRFPKVSPLLGPVKMSVTVIHAGQAHNVVPDTCNMTVDVRVNELYKNQEVLDVIKQNVESDVEARSTRLGSSAIPESHPLVRRAKALGLKPYGSPTLSDQALMPWLSMKLGPGDSARSHTADEFITLTEIRDAVGLYLKLLDGLELN